MDVSHADYEPTFEHTNAVQGNPGKLEPDVLQCPSTASSGRRLMVVNFGASYGFRRSISFICSSIEIPFVSH
jgi:hypothetical protein